MIHCSLHLFLYCLKYLLQRYVFSGWKVRYICAGGNFTWDFLGICSQWWHTNCSLWMVLFMCLCNYCPVDFDLDVYFTQWYIIIFFLSSNLVKRSHLLCLSSNTDGEWEYSPSRRGEYFQSLDEGRSRFIEAKHPGQRKIPILEGIIKTKWLKYKCRFNKALIFCVTGLRR